MLTVPRVNCKRSEFVTYPWDSWAKNTLPFSPSTSGILDCNSNPCRFLLCTGAWHLCTSQGRCQKGWLWSLHFLLPLHFRLWIGDHRFWGHRCTLPRDRARLRAPSIAPHSWLPGRKSLPRGCCAGGSRWRCSCGWRRWTHCQRNPPRRWLWCFLEIIV